MRCNTSRNVALIILDWRTFDAIGTGVISRQIRQGARLRPDASSGAPLAPRLKSLMLDRARSFSVPPPGAAYLWIRAMQAVYGEPLGTIAERTGRKAG